MGNQKMAVVIIILGALAVIFLYYALLNQSIESASKEKKNASTTLSDFQVTACNAADRSGTCRTKLPKLNLITPEECCKYLGKCCQNRG